LYFYLLFREGDEYIADAVLPEFGVWAVNAIIIVNHPDKAV